MSVRNADIRKYTSETQHSMYLCFKQMYINKKSENRQNNTVIGQISLTFAMLSKKHLKYIKKRVLASHRFFEELGAKKRGHSLDMLM